MGRHRPHRHAARHEQPGAASAGKDETRPACRRSLRLMSVSVARIPKNRCRTTAAEPIGGNASGTALYRRPSDRDRIVTTGPSRFQPASPEVLRRDDVGCRGAGIPKNRCRTTAAEPIGGNASGTALYRDQVGLFKTQPGRPNPSSATTLAVQTGLSSRLIPAVQRTFWRRLRGRAGRWARRSQPRLCVSAERLTWR